MEITRKQRVGLLPLYLSLYDTYVPQFEPVMKQHAATVKRALEEPIRQIAENAGLDGAVIAEKAKNENNRFHSGRRMGR